MVQRIDFVGLSPELQQRVQNTLTIREGDTVSRVEWERLRESLRGVDEHLVLIMQGIGNGDPQRSNVNLRILLQADGANPAGPRPVAVGEAVASSRVLLKVPPEYPSVARLARVQGAVQLGVTIGPDGKVQDVQLISGAAMLAQAAVDAVRQWVYQPLLLNGQPVAVQTTVTVNFVLN